MLLTREAYLVTVELGTPTLWEEGAGHADPESVFKNCWGHLWTKVATDLCFARSSKWLPNGLEAAARWRSGLGACAVFRMTRVRLHPVPNLLPNFDLMLIDHQNHKIVVVIEHQSIGTQKCLKIPSSCEWLCCALRTWFSLWERERDLGRNEKDSITFLTECRNLVWSVSYKKHSFWTHLFTSPSCWWPWPSAKSCPDALSRALPLLKKERIPVSFQHTYPASFSKGFSSIPIDRFPFTLPGKNSVQLTQRDLAIVFLYQQLSIPKSVLDSINGEQNVLG